jgi:hypothetical protein
MSLVLFLRPFLCRSGRLSALLWCGDSFRLVYNAYGALNPTFLAYCGSRHSQDFGGSLAGARGSETDPCI